jgi:hypothetical protein
VKDDFRISWKLKVVRLSCRLAVLPKKPVHFGKWWITFWVSLIENLYEPKMEIILNGSMTLWKNQKEEGAE